MELPAFKAAYAKGQQLAAIEGFPIPAQSDPAWMSVRALDYTKRGLNDVIGAGGRAGTMARGEARALNACLTSVLDAIGPQSPAYAAARDSFAGHSALLDASESGAAFMRPSTTAADIAADLNSMTPGEAHVYRTTAANSGLAKVEAARGSATGKADLISKLYDSIGGQAKLRALFPDDASADAFESTMEKMATENATRSFVTDGSQTADEAAAAAQLGGANPLGSVAGLLHAAAHPLTATSAALQHLGDAAAARAVSGNAARLAPALDSTDVNAVVARMAAETARREAAARTAALLAPRGGSLVGDSIGSAYGRPDDVR